MFKKSFIVNGARFLCLMCKNLIFKCSFIYRSEAIALLNEAKNNVLPLFKFIELFNKR